MRGGADGGGETRGGGAGGGVGRETCGGWKLDARARGGVGGVKTKLDDEGGVSGVGMELDVGGRGVGIWFVVVVVVVGTVDAPVDLEAIVEWTLFFEGRSCGRLCGRSSHLAKARVVQPKWSVIWWGNPVFNRPTSCKTGIQICSSK